MYDELTALHEASHAVTADALGRDIELVTIEPGERWAGCCWATAHPVSNAAVAGAARQLHRPLITWPAELQARLAADVAVAVAGDLGEAMFGPRFTGRVRTPAAELAADQLTELYEAAPEATATERELAAASVSDPSLVTDADTATGRARVAHGIRGLMRSAPWLAWCAEEARAILLDHEDDVRRLASLLMLRGTIGGEGAAACLHQEVGSHDI